MKRTLAFGLATAATVALAGWIAGTREVRAPEPVILTQPLGNAIGGSAEGYYVSTGDPTYVFRYPDYPDQLQRAGCHGQALQHHGGGCRRYHKRHDGGSQPRRVAEMQVHNLAACPRSPALLPVAPRQSSVLRRSRGGLGGGGGRHRRGVAGRGVARVPGARRQRLDGALRRPRRLRRRGPRPGRPTRRRARVPLSLRHAGPRDQARRHPGGRVHAAAGRRPVGRCPEPGRAGGWHLR